MAQSMPTDTFDELTRFQLDCVAVVRGHETGRYEGSRGEPHGLAIKTVLEEQYGKTVHHGRLYPNLDTLVEKGYLNKEQLDRRTNAYSTTEKARAFLTQRAAFVGGSE